MTARIDKAALVALFSPTLGLEKSEETIAQAAQKLGYGTPDAFAPEQASAILFVLTKAEGLVGVVARFALARADTLGLAPEAIEAAPETPRQVAAARPMRASVPPPAAQRVATTPQAWMPGLPTVGKITAADLLSFLGTALGEEIAKEAIQHHAHALGFGAEFFSRPQALATLEAMAQVDGILGVVARFAIARFILRFPA